MGAQKWERLKEGRSFGNLSIVAFHAAKVPTNMFSSTLIFHLTLDYLDNLTKIQSSNAWMS